MRIFVRLGNDKSCLKKKNHVHALPGRAAAILQWLCQVSLGLKEVQMGAHDFKLKKVHLFAQRPVNTNVLRSASQKIALVSASRYNCHIYNYMLMSVPSLIRIERGLDGGL